MTRESQSFFFRSVTRCNKIVPDWWSRGLESNLHDFSSTSLKHSTARDGWIVPNLLGFDDCVNFIEREEMWQSRRAIFPLLLLLYAPVCHRHAIDAASTDEAVEMKVLFPRDRDTTIMRSVDVMVGISCAEEAACAQFKGEMRASDAKLCVTLERTSDRTPSHRQCRPIKGQALNFVSTGQGRYAALLSAGAFVSKDLELGSHTLQVEVDSGGRLQRSVAPPPPLQELTLAQAPLVGAAEAKHKSVIAVQPRHDASIAVVRASFSYPRAMHMQGLHDNAAGGTKLG